MRNSKRIISLFLTVLMVLTSVPFTAFSVDGCAHEWDAGTVSVEATCTQDGQATYTCGLCNETKTETVPALEHDFDETIEENVTTAPATCTEDGSKTVKCSRCDETKVTVLEKTGHTPVIDAKVDPTCTATGLTEGSHCSVCDAVLTAQDVIAVLGHNFDDSIEENVTIVPATCTADGSKTVKCSRCDATDVTVLTQSGHEEYAAPVWTWTADLESGSAVATFTCLKDDDVQTPEVTVTSEVTLAPTCTQTGVLTYTAKTTFRDAAVSYTHLTLPTICSV